MIIEKLSGMPYIDDAWFRINMIRYIIEIVNQRVEVGSLINAKGETVRMFADMHVEYRVPLVRRYRVCPAIRKNIFKG